MRFKGGYLVLPTVIAVLLISIFGYGPFKATEAAQSHPPAAQLPTASAHITEGLVADAQTLAKLIGHGTSVPLNLSNTEVESLYRGQEGVPVWGRLIAMYKQRINGSLWFRSGDGRIIGVLQKLTGTKAEIGAIFVLDDKSQYCFTPIAAFANEGYQGKDSRFIFNQVSSSVMTVVRSQTNNEFRAKCGKP